MKIDRVGPRDVEAERQLLTAALIPGADVAKHALDAGLCAGDFSEPSFAVIWGAIEECVRAGAAVESPTLYLHLPENHRSGRTYAELRALDFTNATSTGAAAFVDRLILFGRLRRKKTLALTLAEAAARGDAETVATVERDLAEIATPSTSDLPEIIGWDESLKSPQPKPPELISGVLHQGAKMMLGGGSKSFKTWTLMDLALSVSTATPWWGLRTAATRVLYVNFELPRWAFDERRAAICAAKSIPRAEFFDAWHLRGFCAPMESLVPKFVRAALRRGYGLIVLDPIYKALGNRDENSNGDISTLLNEVEALAVRLGAAVVFGHHFSKGNQSAKEAKDRVSGAGAWSRDPDTLMTLTAHDEEDCFTVDFVLRNFPPRAQQVVRWRHPCMEVAADLDPGALRQAGRPKVVRNDDVLELLPADGASNVEWTRLAAERGISEPTFRRRRNELLEAGKIECVMNVWRAKR